MKRTIEGGSSRIRPFRPLQRGQSLVEIALVFPFVLLLLAGLIEVGHYVNTYLTVLDASREAARFGADLDPHYRYADDFIPADHPDECGGPAGSANGPDSEACLRIGCELTTYFYHKVACLVSTNLQEVELDLSDEHNDVVISVAAAIAASGGLTITERLPAVNPACRPEPSGTCSPPYCCQDECSWSWTNEIYDGTILAGTGQESRFTCSELAQLLNSGSQPMRRQNGFVIVEVFYEHKLALNLPIISQVIPDPIQVRAYSIMPVSAAEPTPTKVP
jgi:hypothetical protein